MMAAYHPAAENKKGASLARALLQTGRKKLAKEALLKSVMQSELPLAWGIYAPKVSIPLEGKVPFADKGAPPPCSEPP
jgi:hypothetical protein